MPDIRKIAQMIANGLFVISEKMRLLSEWAAFPPQDASPEKLKRLSDRYESAWSALQSRVPAAAAVPSTPDKSTPRPEVVRREERR
ncbi:MAG: hypothetical protein M3O22_04645, partial [Pseudomonadota bacterium]|nr:hypothetical protein [Pseudomonadota bacterium]